VGVRADLSTRRCGRRHMLIADAQIHLWTNDAAPPHHRRKPFGAQEALQAMDAAGVSRAVNCPAIWDPGANEYGDGVALMHPDRFATLGWFDLLRSPDPGFVNVFLDRPGMLGLRFVIMRPEDCRALALGHLDWIWEVAHQRSAPVAVMVPPAELPQIDRLARRFPSMRVLIDHLAIGPFAKLPQALEHLPVLLTLADRPNVALKATATPSMANDAYPYPSVHPYLERLFHAFGAQRYFWGTDITRMRIGWRECIEMFTEHLPWLKGEALAQVMGRSLCEWIGWRY
jgi:predicted TIM-barrel fold metal-dependent hydrolase